MLKVGTSVIFIDKQKTEFPARIIINGNDLSVEINDDATADIIYIRPDKDKPDRCGLLPLYRQVSVPHIINSPDHSFCWKKKY